MVVARLGELTSAVYYPLDYWVQDVLRVEQTSESRLPGNLSRRFHLNEPNLPFDLVVNSPAGFAQATNGRVGDLVINGGIGADRAFAVTPGGINFDTPVTATNNRFTPGTTFMSFAANWAGTSITMRAVSRSRDFYPMTNNGSTIATTQNNTPHFMYTLSGTGTEVIVYPALFSSMRINYQLGATFALRGSVVTFTRINQQLSDPLNTRTPIQRSTYIICPYSSSFRTNDLDTINGITGTDTAYFPIFGIDTLSISAFYKLSNRLAVVTTDGTLYLSTLGTTHPNYPSLFDFEVKLDGSVDNAVMVKLNASITGIVELPNGYLITTNNGLYQYDPTLDVVTLLTPGNYTGVVNNGGFLYVTTNANKVLAYVYNDKVKQPVVINTSSFEANNTYFNTESIYKYQDYPINDNAKITGMGNNWISFLNETQILNRHIYECAYAQPILDLIAVIPTVEANINILPLRETLPIDVSADTVDWCSNSSFPQWSSSSITTVLPRKLRNSNRNFILTFNPSTNEVASYADLTSTVSGSIPFTCVLQSTRQTYSEYFNGASKFKQNEVSVTTKWTSATTTPNFSYFPVYERNNQFGTGTSSNAFYSLVPTAFNQEFRAKVRVPFGYTSHFLQWNNAAISSVNIKVDSI